MTSTFLRKQFTTDDFTRMRETGILTEDDRVELIDGEVREMSPIGSRHAAVVKRLNMLLSRAMAATLIISVQDPIQLNNRSQPQPDLALLFYRDDYYAGAHPVADDVCLVIEVAESSIEYDREEKLPRYAAANIAEAWLIDLGAQRVELYSQPRGGTYRLMQIVERGETIESPTLPKLRIATEEIFA